MALLMALAYRGEKLSTCCLCILVCVDYLVILSSLHVARIRSKILVICFSSIVDANLS